MRNSNRYTFSFIPHVCYFLYHVWIAASKDRIITSLFSTKMRGKETQAQEHESPAPCCWSFVTPAPLPSVKNIQNQQSIRKFKYARHLN